MSSNASLYGIGASATSLASAGVLTIVETRNPTSTDVSGPAGTLKIGQIWVNTAANTSYILTSLSTIGGTLAADWTSTGGGGSGVNSITGNSGPPLSGAVDIVGGTGITTSGAGSTLTITNTGSGANTFTGNSGVATESGGNINILGGTGISTTATGSTVTINNTGVDTLTGNTGGPLSPSAGNINVVGSGSIAVAGAGSTLTISSTASPAIDTLTGDSGGAISPVSGNIDISGGTSGYTFVGTTGTLTLTSSGSTATTFNGDSGTATPVSGAINIKGLGDLYSVVGSGNTLTITPTPGAFPVSPYIVGPVGQAGYQTIQSAITAAAAEAGATIWIQPGTYTENLTFSNNVTLIGSGSSPEGSVIISGTHTPLTASGSYMAFKDLVLTSSSGSIFTSAAAGSSNFTFDTVILSAFNGYTLNLPNWTSGSTFIFLNCVSTPASGGTTDGVVNAINASVYLDSCISLGYGGNSGNSFSVANLSLCLGTLFGVPVAINSGASSVQDTLFSYSLTVNTTATGTFYNCHFANPSALPALNYNSSNVTAAQFVNCEFNAPPGSACISLTGTPYLNITGAEFTSNASIVGAQTNLTWGSSKTGNTTIIGSQTGFVNTSVNFAASPYSVSATDFYLAVNSSGGAITITLPALATKGSHLIIADASGNAGTNNITVSGNGNNIAAYGSSAATQLITTNYGLLDLTFNGTIWIAEQFTSASGAGVTTITGDSGGAISPTAGNINLKGLGDLYNVVGSGSTLTITPTAGAFPVSPYIVGPVGQAGYQTIQSAITAASGAGGGTVWIQPGTYTENLTLAANVALIGSGNLVRILGGTATQSSVNIIGNHTAASTGPMMFGNIQFTATSGNAISSTAAGTANMAFINVLSEVTNGYLLSIPNWTSGTVDFENCGSILPSGGMADGFFTGSGASCLFHHCADVGYGTANVLTLGNSEIQSSVIIAPVSQSQGFSFVSGSYFGAGFTVAGTSYSNVYDSNFFTATPSPTVVISSSGSNPITFANCVFNTSNSIVFEISGSAPVEVTGGEFPDNATFGGTLTNLTWGTTISGMIAAEGNVQLMQAGSKLEIATGSNASIGTSAPLAGGSVTVPTTAVTALSNIFLSRAAASGTLGNLSVGTITAGVSFTITSDNVGDNSNVNWLIIN
jgi:hypothetical protein